MTTLSEDVQIMESQIDAAGLPGGLDKDHTINKLKEETTTLPKDVYQQSQQIPATSYKKRLLSSFKKLLLCYNLGDKQNKRHDVSIPLNIDHDQRDEEDDECGIDKLYCGTLSSSEYPELFSKLSYERKGFDGRGNDSQEQVLQPVPVPVPTPVLKT